MKFYKKKKTALVLGGGAARGLAHLGILKVFKRENIKFDFVLGTSIGALFAAIWALGLDLEKIEKTALRITAMDILDVTISRVGLCKGNKMEYLIRETLQDGQFEDAKMPLSIMTSDVEDGTSVVHSSGNLAKLVKASCAIPGIFQPVEIDGRLLIDGGITNNVPVAVAKQQGASHVVAVDVGYCIRKSGINNMLNIIIQSFQIMGQRLNVYETRKADIVLRPELGEINQTEFNKAEEIIREGQVVAERSVRRVKHLTEKGLRGMGAGFLWE